MDFSSELRGGILLRPVQKLDAKALADAFQRNRTHLAPWEPIRPDRFYTVQGQQEVIVRQRRELTAGTGLPMVLAREGEIVGLLTISSIVRGTFQNAHIGYWLDQDAQGSGIMTAAVGAATTIAGELLDLHRLEAATLLHNAASQRVLEKNGFEAYGTARAYLKIASQWQAPDVPADSLKKRGPDTGKGAPRSLSAPFSHPHAPDPHPFETHNKHA